MNFLFKHVPQQFCSAQHWPCSFPGLLTFIRPDTLWLGLHEWKMWYLQGLRLRRSHLCVLRGTRKSYPNVRVVHYRTSCCVYCG